MGNSFKDRCLLRAGLLELDQVKHDFFAEKNAAKESGVTHVYIWQRQVDNSVESARPGEGRVQGCRPVGGSHDHHACVVLKPVHLCQQLIDGVHRLCTYT